MKRPPQLSSPPDSPALCVALPAQGCLPVLQGPPCTGPMFGGASVLLLSKPSALACPLQLLACFSPPVLPEAKSKRTKPHMSHIRDFWFPPPLTGTTKNRLPGDGIPATRSDQRCGKAFFMTISKPPAPWSGDGLSCSSSVIIKQ